MDINTLLTNHPWIPLIAVVLQDMVQEAEKRHYSLQILKPHDSFRKWEPLSTPIILF